MDQIQACKTRIERLHIAYICTKYHFSTVPTPGFDKKPLEQIDLFPDLGFYVSQALMKIGPWFVELKSGNWTTNPGGVRNSNPRYCYWRLTQDKINRMQAIADRNTCPWYWMLLLGETEESPSVLLEQRKLVESNIGLREIYIVPPNAYEHTANPHWSESSISLKNLRKAYDWHVRFVDDDAIFVAKGLEEIVIPFFSTRVG